LAGPQVEKSCAYLSKAIIGQTDLSKANLTGAIYSAADARDEKMYDQVAPRLRRRVGRLLNDKMPTGVAVSPAMQHGGPYPATTDARSTSVGTAAIARFLRPVAYQNWPDAMLPPELQDANPLAIRRQVGLTTTTGPIERAG
jgi:NADP-dependent aldehyde dehydrogenase